MRRSSARGLTIALLGCSALLMGVILVELRMGAPDTGSVRPVPPAPITDVTRLGARLFAHPPLEEFREVIERPLFHQTRRPYEPPPEPAQTAQAAPTPASTSPPRITLMGIVVTPQIRSALLWDELKREFIRASEGMSVSGWALSEVTLEGITLRQGQRDYKIELLDRETLQANYQKYRRDRGQVSQK